MSNDHLPQGDLALLDHSVAQELPPIRHPGPARLRRSGRDTSCLWAADHGFRHDRLIPAPGNRFIS